MASCWLLGLVYIAVLSGAQVAPECGPSSTSTSSYPPVPCNILYTASVPPQIGPTSTVFATIVTTRFNVVNCALCQITNIAQNPVPQGPFTTRVTSDYLLIPEIACIITTPRLDLRRDLPAVTAEPTKLIFRGAKPQTFSSVIRKSSGPRLWDILKRQQDSSSSLSLDGEPGRLFGQLLTLFLAISVINSGDDLGAVCLQSNSANAQLDLGRLGLNSTQASIIICAASQFGADLSIFNRALLNLVAASLYAVEIAANFLGTTNPDDLCTRLDFGPLASFGVDGAGIQKFVCAASNSTISPSLPVNASITADATGDLSSFTSSTFNITSFETFTPFPVSNASEILAGTGSGSIFSISGGRPSRAVGPPISTQFDNTTNATSTSGIPATSAQGTGSLATGIGAGPDSTEEAPFGNVTSTGDIIGTGVTSTSVTGTGDFPFDNVTLPIRTTITGSNPVGTGDFSPGSVNSTLQLNSTEAAPTEFSSTSAVPTADFPSSNSSNELPGSGIPGAAATSDVLSGNLTVTPEPASATLESTTAAGTGNLTPVNSTLSSEATEDVTTITVSESSFSASPVVSMSITDDAVIITVTESEPVATDISTALESSSEETASRSPQGPMSTPRYYQKYF